MSEFWGYPYADVLAIVAIAGLSAVCLLCARLYVKNY
jgi:hypothetical protein